MGHTRSSLVMGRVKPVRCLVMFVLLGSDESLIVKLWKGVRLPNVESSESPSGHSRGGTKAKKSKMNELKNNDINNVMCNYKYNVIYNDLYIIKYIILIYSFIYSFIYNYTYHYFLFLLSFSPPLKRPLDRSAS